MACGYCGGGDGSRPLPVNSESDAREVSADRPTVTAGVEEQSLDPRVIRLWRTRGLVGAGVLVASGVVTIALMVWLDASRTSLMIAGAIFGTLTLLLAWKAMNWPPVKYRWASYRVSADGVLIRRGVYWRSVIHVPRSRIQHTDVSQGPVARRYGLATLVMHTAGTSNAEIKLMGLDAALAYQIRDSLLPSDRGDGV